jgi:serpin B
MLDIWKEHTVTILLATRRFAAVALLLIGVLLVTSGCGGPVEAGIVQSEQPREETPEVAPETMTTLVDANTQFAFDLYQALRAGDAGNLFYSPYSISLALAMTYAGAEGATAQQMAETLHFTLPEEQLHPAFNALDQELEARNPPTEETEDSEETAFKLRIANAIWGQAGYTFRDEFLDTLAANYGSGLRTLDFQSAPEASRETINGWVSEQTEGRITDLLPSGTIDAFTRMVLTNAIYFNAAWVDPFESEATRDDTFNLLDGSQITVPMMFQREELRYTEGANYQAVELPYKQGFSMVILLPEAGQFPQFEETLDAAQVQAVVGEMAAREVILSMPKFEFEGTSFSLKRMLTAMGMTDAFAPDAADFSGMDGTRELFISDLLHQASITVDEAGTEAAAATAAVVGVTSAMPPEDEPVEMTIDRPFVFMIRDTNTGAVLFVGRVVNPTG